MDAVKLEKCLLHEAPENLPVKLKEHITNIIEAIKYAESGNYECYVTLKRSVALKYDKDSAEWFDYIRELNRLNRCLVLIKCDEMQEAWFKFDKLNESSLPLIYNFFVNKFCDLIEYQPRDEALNFLSVKTDKMKEYSFFNENPQALLEKAKEVYDIFEKHMCLIAPDGADCFDDLADNDPDKLWSIDWSLYISDDDYYSFMATFNNILKKVYNKAKLKEGEKSKIISSINNTESRKKNIEGALEIKMAKILYKRFIELFNKPLYREITLILEGLFGSDYQENDIIKITKPLRDNIKKLKSIIKEDGFKRFYHSTSLENDIAKHIKSED